MEYVLEDIIAENQVNLLAGGSGSGKSRLLFMLRAAIELGGKLFGRQTKQVRWGYIAGDRTSSSIHETLSRMGLSMPVFSCVDNKLIGARVQDVFPRLVDVLGYRPEILAIDGFTSFVPKGELNNYSVVAKWLGELQNWCDEEKVTIVGCCHTTKTREGEKLLDPRQRIVGSVAWASYSEGVIVIDKPFEEGEKEPWREISLCSRNHGTKVIHATFDDTGWMVEREGTDEGTKEDVLEFLLGDLLLPGTEIVVRGLERVTEENKIHRATLYRWIKKGKESGRFLEAGRGKFVVASLEDGEELMGVVGTIQ